jgi:hypothetical protein
MMGDMREPRWMVVKAVLLVGIGVLSGGLLVLQSPTVRTGLLLGVCVWAFARAYYFCFYVIERYIDPGFRFAGIFSAVKFLATRGRR